MGRASAPFLQPQPDAESLGFVTARRCSHFALKLPQERWHSPVSDGGDKAAPRRRWKSALGSWRRCGQRRPHLGCSPGGRSPGPAGPKPDPFLESIAQKSTGPGEAGHPVPRAPAPGPSWKPRTGDESQSLGKQLRVCVPPLCPA